MDNSEFQGFHIKISTKAGTYTVWVWRNEEIIELEIEEPSAKKSQYFYELGKLKSRQYIGGQAYYIKPLRWSMEKPIFEVVSQEIEQVATEAVERYSQYEREGK